MQDALFWCILKQHMHNTVNQSEIAQSKLPAHKVSYKVKCKEQFELLFMV
jgi:hypothetical protein